MELFVACALDRLDLDASFDFARGVQLDMCSGVYNVCYSPTREHLACAQSAPLILELSRQVYECIAQLMAKRTRHLSRRVVISIDLRNGVLMTE
jgi:hypothetical protein